MQSLRKFKDLSLRKGTLVSWFSMILDDEDIPQGQQHCL